jgi:hypothetical protein
MIAKSRDARSDTESSLTADAIARPPGSLVTRWALLAYLVIAGMLEYVFVLDHTRGRVLLVLTLMLVLFAVDTRFVRSTSCSSSSSPPGGCTSPG